MHFHFHPMANLSVGLMEVEEIGCKPAPESADTYAGCACPSSVLSSPRSVMDYPHMLSDW